MSINDNSSRSIIHTILKQKLVPYTTKNNQTSVHSTNSIKQLSEIVSNRIKITRLSTLTPKADQEVPFTAQWHQIFNRRQNFLNSKFNRRKTLLQDISRQNRGIYMRIANQQSHYSGNNKGIREFNSEKDKDIESIQTLTSKSRMILNGKSKQISTQLYPIQQKIKQRHKNKQNKLQTVNSEVGLVTDSKINSKLLSPIRKNKKLMIISGKYKFVQSRYVKGDECLRQMIEMGVKARAKSVQRSRAKLGEIFVNF